MHLCAVVRSDMFFNKLHWIGRLVARFRVSKQIRLLNVNLSFGQPLSILVIPESLGEKRCLKKLKGFPSMKTFDAVFFEPSFAGCSNMFLGKENFFFLENATANKNAQIILNLSLLDRLFDKTSSAFFNKNELSIGISISEEWQFSFNLISKLASKARYLTILTQLPNEFFKEQIQRMEMEYGLECILSQDKGNGLSDCDLIISYGLPDKTRLKRDAVIIDVLNNLQLSQKRRVVNGFEVQPLINPDEDKDLTQAIGLVRKNIGIKILLLYILFEFANLSNEKITDQDFRNFWLENENIKDILQNNYILKEIRNSFAQIGLYINTICKEGC